MGVPLAFLRPGPPAVRVPVFETPFRIGADPSMDLVIEGPGVRGHHATLDRRRGEPVLSGEEDAPLSFGGRRAPFFVLRPGDEIGLGEPPAVRLVFEDRMADAFVPPGASLAEAWLAHPASESDPGPRALDPSLPPGGAAVTGSRRVATASGPVVVKLLGRMRSNEDGDHHLLLLSRLAGSPHPFVATVLDGGLTRCDDGGAVRWLASRWVVGTSARDHLAASAVLSPAAAFGVLSDLAAALDHLHGRGVVHRDLSPGNVVLRPQGGATLIDLGGAVLPARPRPPLAGVVGTPGYLAPELLRDGEGACTPAADVYGLAATTYGLLTGRAPAVGRDVLETLAQSTRRPTAPSVMGVEIPRPLERVLLEALDPDPPRRPPLADLRDAAADYASADAAEGHA